MNVVLNTKFVVQPVMLESQLKKLKNKTEGIDRFNPEQLKKDHSPYTRKL